MITYVAQRSRPEKSVAKSMESHVGIAVPQQSQVMRNIHAAYPQFAPGHKSVHVKSVAYSECRCSHVVRKLSAAAEDLLQSVHVESKRETQCLVEG